MPGTTTQRKQKAPVNPPPQTGGNGLEPPAQHEQSGLDQLPEFLRDSLHKVSNASSTLMPSLNR
jgi:hypothetical protein